MNGKGGTIPPVVLLSAAVAACWWTWPGATVAADTSAVVIRVDVDSTAATPDGLSWETAYTSVQDGVDAAASAGGGEVWVAEGTYTGRGYRVVTMREQVHIYGGFRGTEIARDQRDWRLHLTLIDGEDTRGCVLGADNATLNGLAVRDGSANSDAGLYNWDSSPHVANCTFAGNTAWHGAGMWNAWCAPSVANCMFTGNIATRLPGGGALFNLVDCSPTFTKCTFEDNAALNGSGGAVHNDLHCWPEFINCLFVRNTADLFGGAMWNYDTCSPSFVNCTFAENTATEGGAVYDEAVGDLTFTNCVLWGDEPDEVSFWPKQHTVVTMTYSCVDGGYEGEGNIDADPLFVDAAGGNFRLDAASPCIDAGCLVAEVTEDFEGDARGFDGSAEPRGDGSDYDMGADEYVSPHSADTDQDRCISVREISRVIAFYNAGAYHIDETTQDGYAPFEGPQDGAPHDSDYTPQDWAISIPEISRLVTFYNAGGYTPDPDTPDGFAPRIADKR